MTDALKGIEPQEVVGQIIASPKVQLAIGAVTTTAGGAMVKAAETIPDFSTAMVYLGMATVVSGLVLTWLCIFHRSILIKRDLKNKE